jgi:catechol 2,3-dioxygenase-like lactoylglutathione lyase family enzyme
MSARDRTAAAECRVGIEHVGITVPSIAEATEYFERAFGAEVLYDLIPGEFADQPEAREVALAAVAQVDLEDTLGAGPQAKLNAMRMLALGDGPPVELFEYHVDGQRDPVVPSDLGIHHICVYVDDIEAAASRVVAAGGTLLTGPVEMFGLEGGARNRAWYTKAPWGSTVELITYPDRMPSEDLTSRLRPGRRLA